MVTRKKNPNPTAYPCINHILEHNVLVIDVAAQIHQDLRCQYYVHTYIMLWNSIMEKQYVVLLSSNKEI